MTINVIVAVSDNGVIGKDGKIPWKLSTDLARFKEITGDHDVIMGRKTYLSIGHALRDRRNTVLTSRFQREMCRDNEGVRNLCFRDRDWLPKFAKDAAHYNAPYFIIGGQHIYDEIFKTPELIHRVYLTRVHCNVEGDAFFKKRFGDFDVECWDNKIIAAHEDERWHLIKSEFIPKSDKDEYDSTFQVWENRI